MSEKFYAWLLRLFPQHFRDTYGEDALQLFRDRLRDESSGFARLRLWLDLLFDLLLSLPQEYRRPKSDVLVPASPRRAMGAPAFGLLQSRRPSLGLRIFGGLAATGVFCVFSLSLKQFRSHAGMAAERNAGPSLSSQASVSPGGAAPSDTLAAAARHRLIVAVATNLREHYPDHALGEKVASSLLGYENNGGYDGVTNPSAFADLVTMQMKDLSDDTELALVYSARPWRDAGAGFSPQSVAAYREAMLHQNCSFEKVQILPANVGYFKLNAFPDTAVCAEQAKSAMAQLNHAKALIFDLRDNRGGYPEMTALVGSYLFDHPEYWYNPRDNTSAQSWTHSPVSGNLLADKAVYILTSAQTISGAEQFAYNLKMLKRATIVGETTAGQAHAGVFIRIDAHFGMGIRENVAINPFSAHDWDGTGVAPDVKTAAADALDTAEKLARSRLGQQ